MPQLEGPYHSLNLACQYLDQNSCGNESLKVAFEALKTFKGSRLEQAPVIVACLVGGSLLDLLKRGGDSKDSQDAPEQTPTQKLQAFFKFCQTQLKVAKKALPAHLVQRLEKAVKDRLKSMG